MVARNTTTMKVLTSDLDRYRAFCGIYNIPMTDGLGIFMNWLNIPTIEEMKAHIKPVPISPPFDGREIVDDE